MDPPRPRPDCPLVVAYGLGVNSTAMLVEFAKRGIKPDLILFADTGGEKPETYRYMTVIQDYLKAVQARSRRACGTSTAPYHTLDGQCLHRARSRRARTAGAPARPSSSDSYRTN